MLIQTKEVKVDENSFFWNTYKCDFCKTEFERKVKRIFTEKKRSNISDQIVCHHCGNFIKTWV